MRKKDFYVLFYEGYSQWSLNIFSTKQEAMKYSIQNSYGRDVTIICGKMIFNTLRQGNITLAK